MRGFLLARIAGMGGEGVIEGLAIDVLRVRRQMVLHGGGQIVIGSVGHGGSAFARNGGSRSGSRRHATRTARSRNRRSRLTRP
jgi:hypothetical protein